MAIWFPLPLHGPVSYSGDVAGLTAVRGMKRLPGDLLGYFFGAARAGLNAQNGQQHYVMVMKPLAIMSSILTRKKPTPPLIGSGI